MARDLTHLPLGDLQGDPRNPKAHEVDLIDSLVGRFGYIEPIVLDGRTNLLVSGHGRVKALAQMKARGESPPDGVTPAATGDEWLVPVVTGWSSRTDAEAGAALVALNRAGEVGGWVDEALLDLLDTLAETDDTYLQIGFEETEIDLLREKVAALANAGFLSDLADQDVDNQFTHSGTWGGDDAVALSLPMSLDQRRACYAVITAHQESHGLATRSEGLMHLLGVPFTPDHLPGSPPVPQSSAEEPVASAGGEPSPSLDEIEVDLSGVP